MSIKYEIFQEMDEITDQFRTEDAEEFKQLQVELEVAGQFILLKKFLLKIFCE